MEGLNCVDVVSFFFWVLSREHVDIILITILLIGREKKNVAKTMMARTCNQSHQIWIRCAELRHG